MVRLILIILVFPLLKTTAQTDSLDSVKNNTLTGIIPAPASLGKYYIEYPPIREVDIAWSKTVWRTIDLRQKMNHTFYYPLVPHDKLRSFMGVIVKLLSAKELQVYSTINDNFTLPLSFSEALNVGATVEHIQIEMPDGSIKDTSIVNDFSYHEVLFLRIKEIWFFNKKTSQMEVRIIGICPVKEEYTAEGIFKGYLPMYWIYYPDIRRAMANQIVFVHTNNATQITYDDIFQKRYFSSYINKVSNVYDRGIKDYLTGEDVLLENKLIENQIFNREQDLWEY
jgi:gliding motility associated protien GldN